MVAYFNRFDVAIQNVEGMLRQWHESDPVDEKEFEEMSKYSVHSNRNFYRLSNF